VPTRLDDDATIGPVTIRTPAPGGFTPGAIVAGRYRLVALLGRGGMGEVYRADDLTLDQPVALKFLPGGVADDDSRLAQFHNELRTARQVSHKNVVRLYDLGAADGRRFLTMEYVDGEDLASLLRRIGRIPEDKAVELARQLCAGVGGLIGSSALASLIFDQTVSGIFVAMFAVLGYVLLRLALRRTSFAIAAALVLLMIVQAQSVLASTAPMWMAALFQLSIITIVTVVVVRCGLLVTAVVMAVSNVLSAVPLTLSMSQWTAATSNLTIASVLTLTFFGFYASRAGQPLFGTLEVGS
jgi:hypothetical protein